MCRRSLSILGAGLIGVMVGACGNYVHLTTYEFPERPDSAEVEVIDGTAFSRAELERVVREYHILARYHSHVPRGESGERRLAKSLEKGKGRARELGGDALFYTVNSELVATIVQDARYAGPDDAVVVYILRRKREGSG